MNKRFFARKAVKFAAWIVGALSCLLLLAMAVFYVTIWSTTRPESLDFHASWTPQEQKAIRSVYKDYARIIRTGGEAIRETDKQVAWVIDSEGNEGCVDLNPPSWRDYCERRYAYWKTLRPKLRMIERTTETGDARVQADDGSTLLHAAAAMRRYDLIEPLLNHGADPNARTHSEQRNTASGGDTPLCWVLSPWSPNGSLPPPTETTIDAMRRLIDRGADINARSGIADVPLLEYLSWQPEGEKIAHFMLDRGARPLVESGGMRYSLLDRAIVNRWVSIVKRLLDEGMDPNHRTAPSYPIQLCSPFWETPAPEKDREILLALLAHGADPDLYGYEDRDSETGDRWDEAEKDERCVCRRRYFNPLLASLCDRSSPPQEEFRERDRQSRLMLAELLLKHGANPDLRPLAEEQEGKKKMGETPLSACLDRMAQDPESEMWLVDMMRLLLRHGADASFSCLTHEESRDAVRTVSRLPEHLRVGVILLLRPLLERKTKRAFSPR